MFGHIGRLAIRFRWIVLLGWVGLLIMSLAFAPKVSSALTAGAYAEEETEAARVRNLLKQELDLPPSSLTIVFSSDELEVDSPEFIAEMDGALAGLTTVEGVGEIITPASSGNPLMVSEDKDTAYAVVELDVDPEEATSLLPEIEERLQREAPEALITGVAPIYSDIIAVSERDLKKAEMYAFPLVLVALVVVFGSLVAAGVPLIMGGICVTITLALIYFLGQAMDMSVFVMNMATMLGLGIAIDYSLFIVSRFREELQKSSVDRAVVTTVSTAGKAVFFSGATTFVGLMGLVMFEFMMLRSLGIGGALVVLTSMLAALTLLPAVLSILGPRINALSFLRRPPGRGGFWQRLATWVMKHPLLILVPIVVFLIALGTPVLRIKLGEPDATILPEDAESRQGFEVLRDEFGEGELSPILVAVQTSGSILSPDNVGALYDFSYDIAQDERVARVDSIVTLDPSITKEQYQAMYANPELIPDPAIAATLDELTSEDTTLVKVVSQFPSISDESEALVTELRAAELENDLTVRVTGTTAEIEDIVTELYSSFPKVVLFVVTVIYLALLILFRSVVLPLKAVLMNCMSILASYGALVFIFQEGHFASLLDFTPAGFIEAGLPILLFCILFGLSMDYEVFLLTRIKESYDATGDNTLSVGLGLERSGRIITGAALILIIVTGAFAFTDIIIIKALGVGIAIAIFLDATIIRALLVPATMRLLGRLNWWAPGFIKKLLPG